MSGNDIWRMFFQLFVWKGIQLFVRLLCSTQVRGTTLHSMDKVEANPLDVIDVVQLTLLLSAMSVGTKVPR